MLKLFSVSLVFALYSLCGNAQFDISFARQNILRCADSLTQAFKAKDWEKFARYSYPAMIGAMGGKKEFIRQVSQTFMQVPETAWKKYEKGKILQVVKTSNDLEALIELHSVIEWQGTRLLSNSCLIASSWDGGLFWTFFDSQGDRNAAKAIKPDLSNKLMIPAKNEKTEPMDK